MFWFFFFGRTSCESLIHSLVDLFSEQIVRHLNLNFANFRLYFFTVSIYKMKTPQVGLVKLIFLWNFTAKLNVLSSTLVNLKQDNLADNFILINDLTTEILWQ